MSDKSLNLVRFDTGPLVNPTRSEPKRPLTGSPQFQGVSLFEGHEGKVRGGVWESTSGSFQADTTGYIEFGQIVAGSCRIVDPDGTQHNLVVGDPFVMPEGYQGRWEVDEFVKKAYFIVVTA